MNQPASWKDILQIGDARLRRVAQPVADLRDPAVQADGRRLVDTLHAFREAHGRGRGTAAPQIGVNRRMVALRLPEFPDLIVNPAITWRSRETMTLWEGCMSFPFLLVKARRAVSISVEFTDADGVTHRRERLDPERSELLQHEFDHLDGVLSVDHVIDGDSLLSRDLFNSDREYFLAQVDHAENHRPK